MAEVLAKTLAANGAVGETDLTPHQREQRMHVTVYYINIGSIQRCTARKELKFLRWLA
jgi:hypothetical protein